MTPPRAFRGAVVTMTPGSEPTPDGVVYVDPDGRIDDVRPADATPPAGFGRVDAVATGGTIFPGLIELHEHLLFAPIPLWNPGNDDERYTSRYTWQQDSDCPTAVLDPASVAGLLAAEAVLTYGQLKKVVGGVTSVQGSVRTDLPEDRWFLRNIEQETFDGATGPVRSVVARLTPADLEACRVLLDCGGAFLTHLSEGTDPALRSEFDELLAAGCVSPGLVGIHSVALQSGDFDALARGGAAIVWSPFSNAWLYGSTLDVGDAVRSGVRVCVGSDWSPSGSKNPLGELKVGRDAAVRSGHRLTDADLCAMVTAEAAAAIGWQDQVGTLQPGRMADLCVVTHRTGGPGDLVTAWENDVRLVTIGGRPTYGLADLLQDAGASSTATKPTASIAGLPGERAVALPTGVRDPTSAWAELERLRADPAGFLGSLVAAGALEERPWLTSATVPDDFARPVDLTVEQVREISLPALDTLVHDAAFFRAVAARDPLLATGFAAIPAR